MDRIETKRVFIEDVEVVQQFDGDLVIMNCVTSDGRRFSTAVKARPNGHPSGWRFRQFVLLQKMLEAYGCESEASEATGWQTKPLYSGLIGLYFKFQLRIGPKTEGTRPISIKKFKRCDPFEVLGPDNYSKEELDEIESFLTKEAGQ